MSYRSYSEVRDILKREDGQSDGRKGGKSKPTESEEGRIQGRKGGYKGGSQEMRNAMKEGG